MKKTIHDNFYRKLIHDLTQERVRLNISQSELAVQMGINQSDISKIEKFERRLDVLEFSVMLRVFRIQENLQLQNTIKKFTGIPHDKDL